MSLATLKQICSFKVILWTQEKIIFIYILTENELFWRIGNLITTCTLECALAWTKWRLALLSKDFFSFQDCMFCLPSSGHAIIL